MPKMQNKVAEKLVEICNLLKNNCPELVSIHVMQSLDSLSCIVMGAWTSLYATEDLSSIVGYEELMAEIKKSGITCNSFILYQFSFSSSFLKLIPSVQIIKLFLAQCQISWTIQVSLTDFIMCLRYILSKITRVDKIYSSSITFVYSFLFSCAFLLVMQPLVGTVDIDHLLYLKYIHISISILFIYYCCQLNNKYYLLFYNKLLAM